MDGDSMARLRLDRRLVRRRGWISKEELARELEQLPDVSHKVSSPEPARGRAGGGEAPAGDAGALRWGDAR